MLFTLGVYLFLPMLLLLNHRIKLLAAVLALALMLCFTPWVQSQFHFDETQLRRTAKQKFDASGLKNVERWLSLQTHLDGVPDAQLLKVVNDFGTPMFWPEKTVPFGAKRLIGRRRLKP